MKPFLFFVLLIASSCLLFSCKKEKDLADDRTGLELLTDKNAQNYFVFTEGKDTFVWQDTKGDVIKNYGGITSSNNGQYYYTSVSFSPKTGRITNFYIDFSRPVAELGSKSCAVLDSLLPVGIVPLHTGLGNSVGCTENGNTDLYSQFSKKTQSVEILSVKRVEVGTGCYKLRAKIKLTGVQMKLYPTCPIWDTVTGVMQVDFYLGS